MKHIYEGKTKSVYELEDGTVSLLFKDDVTCANGVFDPGANHTGIKIEGSGLAGLKMSKMFFELFASENLPTHYISCNLDKKTMNVKKVTTFGKGLEIICRTKATGSFLRRYGAYTVEGANLNYFVEATLKDDDREDPLVSAECLEVLNILSISDYNKIKELTVAMTKIVERELAKKGLVIYDIKFEFGKLENGEIVLIDEISGGNMRVFQNGKILMPIELSNIVTA